MALARLRKVHTDVDTEGSWAISYGDLVTLLLAFFIMFFTADKYIKQPENLKIAMLSKALANDRRAPAAVAGGAVYPDTELKDKLKAKTYKIGEKIIVEFPGVSFYKSAKVDLSAEGQLALGQFYSNYQPYIGLFQVSIRAFTDTKQVKNVEGRKFSDNLELSALRSISVMRWLQKAGVPLTAMKLGGYGEMLLTLKDLEPLPESVRKPTSMDDLARTVMLVIEPKEVL